MNKPSLERKKKSSDNETTLECQYCGDLFEIKTLLVPSNGPIKVIFPNFLHLVIPLSGSINIFSHNEIFELHMGQVWLVASECNYDISSKLAEHGVTVLSIKIQEAMLNRFCNRYDNTLFNKQKRLNLKEILLPQSDMPIIFPDCQLTNLALSSFQLIKQTGDEQLIALKLEELLLLKLNSDHGQLLANEFLNRMNHSQEKFRRFMEGNATRCWTVAMYAENFGVCLTSFRKLFRQVFVGSSPKSWIVERRLRHADLLLRTSNKRLIEIAEECGFSSQSYFTQIYKSKYGLTPSEARQARK